MNPQTLQSLAAVLASFAALMGGLYAIVTRPLLGQLKLIEAHLDRIDSELKEIRTELKTHGERLARVEERLPPPLVHR